MAQQSKAERLENLAFWYWEYQRRNPEYQKWSETIDRFMDDLEKCAEALAEMSSPKGLVDMIEFERSNPTIQDFRKSKFIKRIESEFGKETARTLYRYSMLNQKFERRFKRSATYHGYGMDSEEALQLVLDGKEPVFKPFDLADVAALLGMHNEWVVQMNGRDPSQTFSMIAEYVTVPIGPHIPIDVFKKASLECEVLYLLSQAAAFWNDDKPALDEEVSESVLDLLEDLKGVNTANIMRLAMLWLWDRINGDDDPSLDFDGKFKKHWGSLKSRADNAGMIEKPWNQIYGKKNRIMKAFESTNYSIQNMTITDLNS